MLGMTGLMPPPEVQGVVPAPFMMAGMVTEFNCE
jgi:hypothetical protein